MKNLILISILIICPLTIQITAQESGDPIVKMNNEKDAKLRFGIKGISSFGWLIPENTRRFSRYELGLGYGWGLNLEMKINKTTSFRTGFSLTNFKAGLNYFDDELPQHEETYYVVNDFEFVEWENNVTAPDGEIFQLLNRKYNLSYVNIPLILKLKTNEIGYFTYFGEFGGLLSLKTKASVEDRSIPLNDSLAPLSSEAFSTFEDLDLSSGTQPFRAGLSLGAGAEYNFSGSTSLFFQLNWNYFVTNVLTKQDNEKYLRTYDDGVFEPLGAKSIPGRVSITVGILF